MITGAHAILYSADPEADRAFVRDVLGLTGVDAGGGWLIFGLPPSEVAVHPAETSGHQELYLLCDDIEAFVAEVSGRGIPCSPVDEQRWGRITHVTLPGGGGLGVYEPNHPRPPVVGASAPATRAAPTKGLARAKAKAKKKAPPKKPTPKKITKRTKPAAKKKPRRS